MNKPRLLYRDWLVEIVGGVNSRPMDNPTFQETAFNERIIKAVEGALKKLTARERDFAIRFYYQGQSLKTIATAWGCRRTTVAGVYERTFLRLKGLLAGFVEKEFGLKTIIGKECPICRSAHCQQINHLIKTKKKEETWKQIIKILKTKYGLKVTTPQILIGHRRYHLRH